MDIHPQDKGRERMQKLAEALQARLKEGCLVCQVPSARTASRLRLTARRARDATHPRA